MSASLSLKERMAAIRAAKTVSVPSPSIVSTVSDAAAAVDSAKEPLSSPKLSLKERIAAMRAAESAAPPIAAAIPAASAPLSAPTSDRFAHLNLTDRYGEPISLNPKQAEAVDMAIAGDSFVITGEAGTGKTTTLQAVGKALWLEHQNSLRTIEYRASDGSGARVMGTSVAYVSYTRKAVANEYRALCQDPVMEEAYAASIMTIHNLLEFAPVIEWSEKQQKDVMIFRPQRGNWNPIEVTHLAIDEATMLGLDLWDLLYDAIQVGVQIIFMGDINQLPPVFGQSVMSYALQKLPIVYLDHVYRQALDNEIIRCAHSVLQGKPFEAEGKNVFWMKGKTGAAAPSALKMSMAMRSWINKAITNELADADTPFRYNADEDMILCPWNKASRPMSTTNINYMVAQRLGEERGAEVFHIIAGFNQWYLAVGDRVFCQKSEGVITRIVSNMGYFGKRPTPSSVNLNRWGISNGKAKAATPEFDYANLDLDELETADDDGVDKDEIDLKHEASHLVTIELETGETVTLSAAGHFNPQLFSLGYSLSVHKSQGSEWPRVILMFHKVHMQMMSRELLYTAMTRARENLIILSREEIIHKAIGNPRIKGNSLEEKIEYFNSGYLDKDVPLTK